MRCPTPGHRAPGVTLLEALITVVVVGIVATVGWGAMLRTIETAKGQEAAATLRVMFEAERAFAADQTSSHYGALVDLENGRYLPGHLDSVEWAYTVALTGSPPTVFTATATRQVGTYKTQQRTINQTGTLTPSSWPP